MKVTFVEVLVVLMAAFVCASAQDHAKLSHGAIYVKGVMGQRGSQITLSGPKYLITGINSALTDFGETPNFFNIYTWKLSSLLQQSPFILLTLSGELSGSQNGVGSSFLGELTLLATTMKTSSSGNVITLRGNAKAQGKLEPCSWNSDNTCMPIEEGTGFELGSDTWHYRVTLIEDPIGIVTFNEMEIISGP